MSSKKFWAYFNISKANDQILPILQAKRHHTTPTGFRFKKRLKFGSFALSFSKQGLSSLSIGGRGASVNVPIARDNGVRQTVDLPGTGLSCTEEASSQQSVRER